uniref:F-box domain-containing protein n=1 Tax=Meloidogyne enterolobii TaxID=390850 RepID=A0A6V7TZJ1_MELEN|nr:unnamed protein product [Meloidogyne enterolobii]
MFYSLPTETKLDIFKFLNYEELCSIKQTNLYFRDFINKFEGELARQKLPFRISINFDNVDDPRKLIRPKIEDFDFPLNEQLEMKLNNGLESPIPLYLPNEDSDKNIVVCLSKVGNPSTFGFEKLHILQLPTIIKNKEDMKIVYYYLNKLFNCSFEYGHFYEFIFNPKLIELLFGNAKRFYIQDCTLLITDYNIENILQFILNHLASSFLEISFLVEKDIMKKYINILFKILSNGGDYFKEINFNFYNSAENLDIVMNATLLYEYIVEYIATSRECPKIVPVIILKYRSHTSLKLSERAEKAEIKQLYFAKSTNYQIANIHNSRVKFSFFNHEWENFPNVHVRIKITKE